MLLHGAGTSLIDYQLFHMNLRRSTVLRITARQRSSESTEPASASAPAPAAALYH